ncbi:hypothetical protein HMPREF3232_01115 [Fannyhessea vaginae]|nr:hypothetical protein HMPREF3232_01115 [Fannyhessea vaginae]
MAIAKFKLTKKCFLLAIAVVRAVMVLTSMSRFFKKTFKCTFDKQI